MAKSATTVGSSAYERLFRAGPNPTSSTGAKLALKPSSTMSFAYFVHIVLVWAVDSFWVVSRADGSGSIT